MSTKMLIAVFVFIVNFWLVFGCVMPVPKMVSDACVVMLRAEAWVIGLSALFAALFYYDQMVLVVEQHKRACKQTCRISTNANVPFSQDLTVHMLLRRAWILSKEKVANAKQCVHEFLQTNV